VLSQQFVDDVAYEIGLPFRAAVGPVPADWDPSIPMPKSLGREDFWITSATHLRTRWAGNTFVKSQRKKREFHLRSRESIQADFLTSELELYPHTRKAEFEAIVLPGSTASILLVMPSADSSIEELETALAAKPDLVEPLLLRESGTVELPPVQFAFEADLRNSLERLGVRRVFHDLESMIPMAPRMGGMLRRVAQKTEITVDEQGIRADSGTIMGGILGGIMAAQEPFRMVLDRPFLFFVRDNLTKALLFEGVVMNPTLH
jgi:serpin B